jgi:hypothetical protein
MSDLTDAASSAAERFHRTLFVVSVLLAAVVAVFIPPEEAAWPAVYYLGLLVLTILAVLSLVRWRALLRGRRDRLADAAVWLFVAGLLAVLIGLFFHPSFGLLEEREPGPDVMTTRANHGFGTGGAA